MLNLNQIRYAYEGTQFEFSMAVEQGSFLAIIGPSGAGKSTLLDLIAGFISPTSGEMAFRGQQLTGLRSAERPVSMVFQENNLFTHLDVHTNIALGISPTLQLSAKDHNSIDAALQRVELQGFQNRLPGELSGGERQRVALARTLVRERPLLLLDEPFAALGPALRSQMLKLVKELHEEKNLTTLLVSHQPEDARSTATHTAFLNNGRIEVLEKTEKFFAITDNIALADYQGNS
ncbi:Thiamin ABC transporter, ATPase component [hydrothermal vent metagenome]|uniref:Thiamin ABC transporter, ATPase component n=1 Tax=hydrothermal vent metagenome TaxID=652676 RepID=A0A3B0R3F2_9ZZZZ